MTDKRRKTLILANALAWAGAMLGVSYLTKGTVEPDTSFTMTMGFIAGWMVMNGLITGNSQTVKDEIKACKKLIGVGK